MSAKTKTALKAESDSTFTTNGVRAITASSHRTFNTDLIDSLDLVKVHNTSYQVAKFMCQSLYTSGDNFPIKLTTGSLVHFPMTMVKDQLLSNVLEIRLMYWGSGSALTPSTSHNTKDVSIIPYINSSDPNYLYGKIIKATGVTFGNFPILEITYIPAE